MHVVFIPDVASLWVFVYLPIAILLFVNVCLFVHLSYVIIRTYRQMRRVMSRPSSCTNDVANSNKQK